MRIALLTKSQNIEGTIRRVAMDISLRRFFNIEVSNFFSLKNFLLSSLEFDIIFVDDDVENRKSVETAKFIRNKFPETPIVLLSNTSSEVYNAFSVKAYRFLVKPIDPLEIAEAIEAYRKEQFSYKLVIAKSEGAFHSFCPDEIIYVETDKRGCILYTGGGAIHVSTPFLQITEQLPEEYFYLVHRSYSVNMMHIRTFSQISLIMKDGTEIPISRRRKMNFFIKYNEFTKSHNFYN